MVWSSFFTLHCIEYYTTSLTHLDALIDLFLDEGRNGVLQRF